MVDRTGATRRAGSSPRPSRTVIAAAVAQEFRLHGKQPPPHRSWSEVHHRNAADECGGGGGGQSCDRALALALGKASRAAGACAPALLLILILSPCPPDPCLDDGRPAPARRRAQPAERARG